MLGFVLLFVSFLFFLLLTYFEEDLKKPKSGGRGRGCRRKRGRRGQKKDQVESWPPDHAQTLIVSRHFAVREMVIIHCRTDCQAEDTVPC